MTWPYARPKPPRLSHKHRRLYQREHPEVFRILRHYLGCWHIEKAGEILTNRETHAEAIEFVSAQLARRGSTSA